MFLTLDGAVVCKMDPLSMDGRHSVFPTLLHELSGPLTFCTGGLSAILLQESIQQPSTPSIYIILV